MSSYSPLGLHLRRLCDERGSTQRRIAEAVGLSPVWVSRLVRGKEEIGDDQLSSVVTLFDLDESEADVLRRARDASRLPVGVSS